MWQKSKATPDLKKAGSQFFTKPFRGPTGTGEVLNPNLQQEQVTANSVIKMKLLWLTTRMYMIFFCLFLCGFCTSAKIINYSYQKGRDSHDYYTCWLMIKVSSQMFACQKLEWLWCVWFVFKLFLNLLSFTKDIKFLRPLIQLYIPILVLF